MFQITTASDGKAYTFPKRSMGTPSNEDPFRKIGILDGMVLLEMVEQGKHTHAEGGKTYAIN